MVVVDLDEPYVLAKTGLSEPSTVVGVDDRVVDPVDDPHIDTGRQDEVRIQPPCGRSQEQGWASPRSPFEAACNDGTAKGGADQQIGLMATDRGLLQFDASLEIAGIHCRGLAVEVLRENLRLGALRTPLESMNEQDPCGLVGGSVQGIFETTRSTRDEAPANNARV